MTDMNNISTLFKSIIPAVDRWSIRLVENEHEALAVRQNILQPPLTSKSKGAFISITKASVGIIARGFWVIAHTLLDTDGRVSY